MLGAQSGFLASLEMTILELLEMPMSFLEHKDQSQCPPTGSPSSLITPAASRRLISALL